VNWTDLSDVTASAEPSVEPAVPAAMTPFTKQRRNRIAVMTMLIGGGLMMIVGMRFLSGGPASATADTGAAVEISSYLAPSPDGDAPDPATDPLAVLAGFGAGPPSTHHASLDRNPFLIPGSSMESPMPLSPVNADHHRAERLADLQAAVEVLRVSVVLQGRRSMAVVGGVNLPIDTPVEFDTDLTLTLIGVDAAGITVEATDPLLGLSTPVHLPRP
jgi:hypothetical protein